MTLPWNFEWKDSAMYIYNDTSPSCHIYFPSAVRGGTMSRTVGRSRRKIRTEQKKFHLSGGLLSVLPQVPVDHFTSLRCGFVLRAHRAAHLGPRQQLLWRSVRCEQLRSWRVSVRRAQRRGEAGGERRCRRRSLWWLSLNVWLMKGLMWGEPVPIKPVEKNENKNK